MELEVAERLLNARGEGKGMQRMRPKQFNTKSETQVRVQLGLQLRVDVSFRAGVAQGAVCSARVRRRGSVPLWSRGSGVLPPQERSAAKLARGGVRRLIYCGTVKGDRAELRKIWCVASVLSAD